MSTRILGVALMALAITSMSAAPALASCAPPPSLEEAFADADLVFIGVVTEVTNNGRTASVDVEQVWKGPEQPFNVAVHGGPDEADLITSVDRTFELGTYIFFPVNSSPPFEDNICTLTQPVSEAISVINPFGEEPEEDEDSSLGESFSQVLGSEFEATTAATSTAAFSENADEGGSGPRLAVWLAVVVAVILGVATWRRRASP